MKQEPTFNQYAAPQAVVDDVGAPEVGELKMFSAQGRIGRLRYLAYSTGGSLIHSVVTTVITLFVAATSPKAMALVSLLLWLPLLWFGAICGIKRCHDIGISGWWTLTMIIPVIALAWIFWPGKDEANPYGPPPPPNTTGVRILGLIFPVVAGIGILAAVAIPAYKNYTDRARAAAQSGAR